VLAGAPSLGRLPVGIPGVAPAGAGLTFLAGTEVPAGDAAAEGIDPGLGAGIRALLERAVAERTFPGAVCIVARHGKVLFAEAVGRHTYRDDAPEVTRDTPYDLASLTKVCATTPAVLALAARGALSLDDPVQKWLPGFTGEGKQRVTLRHLLAHSSGLPAYERYYRTLSGKDAIVAAAAREGLMTEPGERVVYSDLGMMLLMDVVERCSGQPFADFVAGTVWRPLGLRGARFVGRGAEPVAAPPTEDNQERGGLVAGVVHDENAHALGGVSGHAGMFATADDVLRVGLCFLGRGRGELPSTLVDAALREQAQVGSTRALGFDRLGPGGFGGAHVAPGTFGHTGFTGTSLLCDPVRGVCVVLLSNRVHPTRVNARIGPLRQRLHDLVLSACD
jgi:CubicO group peptidase (beta-lactamase class C family)